MNNLGIKKILIIGLFFLSGCQLNTSKLEQKSDAINYSRVTSDECPEQPEVVLDRKNVQAIALDDEPITLSGIAKQNQSLGYTFEAKSDQKFNYRTEEDICIWIYTPDNQLVNSKNLPVDGKYTIQVSAPKGSATFELEIGLDLSQNLSSLNSNISINNSSQSQQIEERPPADEFVINYYIDINNRNYESTGNKLSPRFQTISSSYFTYQKWWDSVSEVRIENIYLIEQTQNTAIVDAELGYMMNTGKYIKDPKQRIYLSWDKYSNSWLFEKKST
ncbi:hypothetical protein IQ238_25245 [Pleurocapsales cyanobacterium LEGE 06147]|nr:hypothetical protein [Pleurocapsales cyanobacterium LEGE 06147]